MAKCQYCLCRLCDKSRCTGDRIACVQRSMIGWNCGGPWMECPKFRHKWLRRGSAPDLTEQYRQQLRQLRSLIDDLLGDLPAGETPQEAFRRMVREEIEKQRKE